MKLIIVFTTLATSLAPAICRAQAGLAFSGSDDAAVGALIFGMLYLALMLGLTLHNLGKRSRQLRSVIIAMLTPLAIFGLIHLLFAGSAFVLICCTALALLIAGARVGEERPAASGTDTTPL